MAGHVINWMNFKPSEFTYTLCFYSYGSVKRYMNRLAYLNKFILKTFDI